MITKELFYTDAYISEFSAKVISCEKADKGYKIILDQTAFFYEGGGQPSDKGTLNGECVLDVQKENGEIVHYTKIPFEIGENVSGKIDFERRFSFMQNHTGEHVVSGVLNKKYGFDNVGFHLNEEFVNLDFNGILNREQIEEIEYLSNKAVWENHEVLTYFPDDSELENMPYRSKKELEGDVRIVEIKGVDMCACCAPHVKSTGEIGIIKLLEFEKLRGGTRLFMKCGNLALSDIQSSYKNLWEIANMLSAKRENSFEIFKIFNNKLEEEKQNNSALKRRLITLTADSVKPNETVLFVEDFDTKDIQFAADLLHKKSGKMQTVISTQNKSVLFAACGEENELKAYLEVLKQSLNVRGGGRGGMISGSINDDIAKIKEILWTGQK